MHSSAVLGTRVQTNENGVRQLRRFSIGHTRFCQRFWEDTPYLGMATLANGACNAMQCTGLSQTCVMHPAMHPATACPPYHGLALELVSTHDPNATLSGKNPVRSINRHLLCTVEHVGAFHLHQAIAEGHAGTVMPGPSLVCFRLLYSFGTGPDPFPAVPFLHDFDAAVQIFSCYCMLQSKQYGLYRSNALFRVCRFYGKIWGVFHFVHY